MEAVKEAPRLGARGGRTPRPQGLRGEQLGAGRPAVCRGEGVAPLVPLGDVMGLSGYSTGWRGAEPTGRGKRERRLVLR